MVNRLATPDQFHQVLSTPYWSRRSFHGLQFGGHQLSIVTSVRDLGVIISSDFKSVQDTNKKVASASRLLWAIRRSFSTMAPEVFKILFSSHVRPILEYGQPATFPQTKGEADRIERVQRRGSKWIKNIRHLPYEQRLSSLNMFSLCYRRRRGDLIFTRRILRGQYGEELSKFFHRNTDGPTRGHSQKLYKPRRLRLRPSATLSTRVINDWNNLPSEVVEANGEDCFKRLLDDYSRSKSDTGAL